MTEVELVAEIERLRIALHRWPCTICYGRGRYLSRTVSEDGERHLVHCYACNGHGLHTIAAAALRIDLSKPPE